MAPCIEPPRTCLNPKPQSSGKQHKLLEEEEDLEVPEVGLHVVVQHSSETKPQP